MPTLLRFVQIKARRYGVTLHSGARSAGGIAHAFLTSLLWFSKLAGTPLVLLLRFVWKVMRASFASLLRFGRLAGAFMIATPRLSKKAAHLSLESALHILYGTQQRSIPSSALIEAPVRVRPGQSYAIRVRLMGRNEPGEEVTGLGALGKGEIINIQLHSSPSQNGIVIQQEAAVQVPAQGYMAEITLPVEPYQGNTSGRYIYLYLYFMDESCQQLYKKPFMIEIFISNLVYPGFEGYTVQRVS